MNNPLSPVSFTGQRNKSVPNSAQAANDVTEKIKELYHEMPKEIFEDGSETTITGKLKSKNSADKMPNKGKILTEAVKYIALLQNEVDTVNRKEVEMKNKLREMFQQMDEKNIDYSDILSEFLAEDEALISNFSSNSTTAEVLLYKLMDIGPLAIEGEVQKSVTPQVETANSNTGSSSMVYDQSQMQSSLSSTDYLKYNL
ncbi:hypothetical protein QEN19_004022 [Hanseniaspora menglaensis]